MTNSVNKKRKYLWIGTPGKHLKKWKHCPFQYLSSCQIDNRIKCEYLRDGEVPIKCPLKLDINISIEE